MPNVALNIAVKNSGRAYNKGINGDGKKKGKKAVLFSLIWHFPNLCSHRTIVSC